MMQYIFDSLKGSEVTIKCQDTSAAYMTFQRLIQAFGYEHIAWQKMTLENFGDHHEVRFSIAKDDANNNCIVVILP